jgi:hypothetical protein
MRLDDRFRWLIWFSLSEIGTMLVFSNYSALLPLLQKEWDLTNPPNALATFGYVPNGGWAFTLLGVGGLVGPLIMWRLKREVKV